MKGIVFTLFEELVARDHGEDMWDRLLEETGLDGAYTAVGNYEDEAFMKLVGAAAGALSTDPDEVVRWFGRSAMPLFRQRYPELFEGHTSARSFVLTLNDVIHPQVRKLLPGAYVPEFEFDDSVPNQVTIGYRSHRHLCSFAEGLIQGAAQLFGQGVEVRQPECQKQGDERCVLVCSFEES